MNIIMAANKTTIISSEVEVANGFVPGETVKFKAQINTNGTAAEHLGVKLFALNSFCSS